MKKQTITYALSVVMSQTTNMPTGLMTTTRQIIGYRRAKELSLDEAVGSFLREAFKNNPGFNAGEVGSILIPSEDEPEEVKP